MANDISARPWKLDTPGASVIWPAQANVKFVEWYNPAALNDTFVLTDQNGKIIVEGIAAAAGDTQTFNVENWFNGIKLPTLASGVLLVHVR
jgi:hypothetical protein